MLRGKYAHNHRIQGNVLATGGARKFRALGHDRSTIGTWRQAAGYRTGLIGKYMNDYRPEQGYVPPGWDEWYAYSHGYYNYVLNEKGTPESSGDQAEDYCTDVFPGQPPGTNSLARARRVPYCLSVYTSARSSTVTPAPRHAHTLC